VKADFVAVAGSRLELFELGDGPPLLFLHGGGGFDPRDPVNALLARGRRLVCPVHPGFGRSALPDWLDRPVDIAYMHLELLDRLGITRTDLIGCSLGGWIAAEMAAMAPERFAKLVLVAPVGVKVGPEDRLDVPDIFALPPDALSGLTFHDPARSRVDLATLSDDELAVVARNRETLALLTWEPYMHDPKLKHRLQRVTLPTLFVRGASDGLISDEYLRAYAALFPNASVRTLEAAGHAPHLEQPDAFAALTLAFLDGRAP
jgi:pimeloyl-ACP methyl ester carboxylesterase